MTSCWSNAPPSKPRWPQNENTAVCSTALLVDGYRSVRGVRGKKIPASREGIQNQPCTNLGIFRENYLLLSCIICKIFEQTDTSFIAFMSQGTHTYFSRSVYMPQGPRRSFCEGDVTLTADAPPAGVPWSNGARKGQGISAKQRSIWRTIERGAAVFFTFSRFHERRIYS